MKITNDQTIISLGNYGENIDTNVFEIEYENNQLQVETETGNPGSNHEFPIDGPETLFDGQWHSILVTFEGENLKYFKDGVLFFSGTYIPAQTTTTSMFIGCYAGTGAIPCCFTGANIDELQFYDRILLRET